MMPPRIDQDFLRELEIFSEHLDLGDMRALSTGLGLGEIKIKTPDRPQLVFEEGQKAAPVLASQLATGEPVETQKSKKRTGRKKKTAKQKKVRQERQNSYLRRCVFWFAIRFTDIAIVGLSSLAVWGLLNNYLLADFGFNFWEWLLEIPMYYSTVGLLAIYFLYLLVFKFLLGLTFGEVFFKRQFRSSFRKNDDLQIARKTAEIK